MRGRVLVNGEERNPTSYRTHCVLIAQELSLLNALTARETLRIAADLKLPSGKLSSQQRDNVVGMAGAAARRCGCGRVRPWAAS